MSEYEESPQLPQFPPIKGKKYTFQYVDLYDIAYDKLLLHSTVIYGDSGEGKSYILNTLLDALSDYINILHIFCPTARVDTKFPLMKFTSPLFVHEVLDMKHVDTIIENCGKRKELRLQIDDPEKLSQSVKKFILPLYKTQNDEEMLHKAITQWGRIRKIDKKFNREDATIDERHEHDRMITKLYHIMMYNCKRYLRKKKLSIPKEYKEHALPILFYDLNYRDVILTNDFGDVLRDLKKNDSAIASKLVMKERHYGITTIHLIQSLGDIKKSDRGQIKVNIFISANAITGYISTLSIKGTLKQQLEEASEFILSVDKERGDKRKYPVVIYFKMTQTVCYTYANSKLEITPKGNIRLYEMLDELVANQVEANPLIDIFGK